MHNLWQHHGSNAPEESHPLFILREAARGERFRCVEYGVVITGCLQALGIKSRTLGLKMKDLETRSYAAGHVVTEAYLKDMDKWVVVDGQWNAIPFIDSTPLNAVELQTAIALKNEDLTFPLLSRTQNLMYKKWISPYLYYFDVTLDETHIILAPEGANEPTVFQRKWRPHFNGWQVLPVSDLNMGTAAFLNSRNRMREDLNVKIQLLATSIAAGIPAREHHDLTDPAQMEGEVYQEIKSRFLRIIDHALRIGFIYSFPTLTRAFEPPCQAHVDPEITQDEYGTWLSAYAPILWPDGSLEGVLGVDMIVSDMICPGTSATPDDGSYHPCSVDPGCSGRSLPEPTDCRTLKSSRR